MKRLGIALTVVVSVVALGGCGGGTSTEVQGKSASPPTTSPSTSAHAAEFGEPALVAVPGYDYEAAPADLESSVDQMAAQTRQFYAKHSAHQVVRDGQPIGVLALFQMTPKMAQMANANPESVLAGAAGGMVGSGGSTSWSTISGEKVAQAKTPDATAYAWYHANTLSMYVVQPGSEGEASGFLTAYLAQANA